MKILNFGSCNIDYVYSVDHMVLPGETISAQEANCFPGGKGLNQSMALSAAGAKVYHAGCVGDDGDFLTDIMTKGGVDIRYVKKVPGMTGRAIIQVTPNGENSIIVHSGSNGEITHGQIDDVLDNFDKGDILVLQNEINDIGYIVDKAYEKGMQIVFNPSPFNEISMAIPLEKISYLFVNQIEAESYSSGKDFVTWKKENYPDLKVVMTLGSKGCVYLGEEEIRQNSYKVKAVDTTGAGDTFSGYFVAGIAMGKSPEESLKNASKAAAIAVSRPGAASAIPEIEEVLSINLEENIQRRIYEPTFSSKQESDICKKLLC